MKKFFKGILIFLLSFDHFSFGICFVSGKPICSKRFITILPVLMIIKFLPTIR